MATEEFVIDPNKFDGYPGFQSMNGFSSPQEGLYYEGIDFICVSTKFDGYPSFRNDDRQFSPPQEGTAYRALFGCDPARMDGYPSFSNTAKFSPAQDGTYYKALMSCYEDYFDGYPSFKNGRFETFAAFKNIPTLKIVIIPKTVKYIADWAFYNTSITEVKINKDCEYFEHSFPEGCKITYYE